MPRPALLYLFSFLFLSACAGQRDPMGADTLASISIVDRNGMTETISTPERLRQYEKTDFLCNQTHQKVLRVFARDDDGGVRSELTNYHPNGQVKQFLQAFNGRAQGCYQEWHENGQMKLDARVIGGMAELGSGAEQSWLFDGCSRAWDEKGELVAEITYEGGRLEGPARYFHSNGALWKEMTYERSLLEGVMVVYLADGTLLESTQYHDGKRHGEARRFWAEGQPAARELFQEDLLVEGIYYLDEGQVVGRVEHGNGKRAIFGRKGIARLEQYKQGVPDGMVEVFNTDGRLARTYHVHRGMKHGEEIEYYPPSRLVPLAENAQPQPKLSVSWYEGVVQGTLKTWYEEGGLESQKELAHNSKQGMSLAWYRDGSLMLIEQYESDRLVSGSYMEAGIQEPVSRVNEGDGVATLFDGDGNFLRKTNYEEGLPHETR
jgi:antitoxin component YwqK of YwqJK toxin-antitoxin module